MASDLEQSLNYFHDENYSDFEDSLAENSRLLDGEQEEEIEAPWCICGIHSTVELIQCSNDDFPVLFCHKLCIDPDRFVSGADWICDICAPQSQSQRHVEEGSTGVTDQPSTSGGEARLPQPGEQSSSVTTGQGKQWKTSRMKYPKRRFNKEDAADFAPQFLEGALDSVNTTPLFKIDSPLMNDVKQLAEALRLSKDKEEVQAFFTKLTKKLWKKVVSELRGKAWTEDAKVKMWPQFHVFRTDHALKPKWQVLLDALSVLREKQAEVFLLQHLLEAVRTSLLTAMMKKDRAEEDEVTIVPPEMDKHEKQALMYYVGYIPYKLRKRYVQMEHNKTAQQFVQVLNTWADSADSVSGSIYESARYWLNVQNRGGLFKVRDNVFSFFKETEGIIRAPIHVKNIRQMHSVYVPELLCAKVCSHPVVIRKWKGIASSLSSESGKKFFEEVVSCYLKMRLEAFVKVYILVRKDKEMGLKLSKKGEKSLRKELAQQKAV